MNTAATGGLLKGLARMVGGGTLFLLSFAARQGGQVAFAADFPGQIVLLELAAGESVVMHKHAFLAAVFSVTLATTFTRRFGAGLLGGDGFVLQSVTGPGMAWAELDGDPVTLLLGSGESMLVEPGHVVMFESGVTFDVQAQRGLKNMLFSGEGVFLARFQGPGRVWLHSMAVSKVAHRVGEYLPKGS